MSASGGWAFEKTETQRFSGNLSVFCSFRRDSGESPVVAGTVGFIWMLAVHRLSEFSRRWSVERELKERVREG